MIEILIIAVIVAFFIFFLMILWVLRKARTLIQESENMYRLAYQDVKEGFIKSKSGHVWDVRHTEPATIKTPIGTQPFYILDYSSAVPINPIKSDKKNSLTPKMLGELIKNETLSKFLSISGMNKKELIMWLVIGVALGFFVAISLVATGVIPLNEAVTTAETPEVVPLAFWWLSV